eukprot:1720375-Pyramimonas_sp.AAC.1
MCIRDSPPAVPGDDGDADDMEIDEADELSLEQAAEALRQAKERAAAAEGDGVEAAREFLREARRKLQSQLQAAAVKRQKRG